MESYNQGKISHIALTQAILGSPLEIFDLHTLSQFMGRSKRAAIFNTVRKLIEGGVLVRLDRNIYVRKADTPSTFKLANALYGPSYISFETALNAYGILSQFPHQITSATVKKSKAKEAAGILYRYSHLQKGLFWGYEKKDGYLIALPEKALLDQIYISQKGRKSVSVNEYDLERLDKQRLGQFAGRYGSARARKIVGDFLRINKIL